MKLTKFDLVRLLYLIVLLGASIFCLVGINRLAERSRKIHEIVEQHTKFMNSSGIYSQLSDRDQLDLYKLSTEANYARNVSTDMKYYVTGLCLLWILFSLFEMVKVIFKMLRSA